MPSIDLAYLYIGVEFLLLHVYAAGDQGNLNKAFIKRVCKTDRQVVDSLIYEDDILLTQLRLTKDLNPTYVRISIIPQVCPLVRGSILLLTTKVVASLTVKICPLFVRLANF